LRHSAPPSKTVALSAALFLNLNLKGGLFGKEGEGAKAVGEAHSFGYANFFNALFWLQGPGNNERTNEQRQVAF